jgi:chemotaxis protein CheZ
MAAGLKTFRIERQAASAIAQAAGTPVAALPPAASPPLMHGASGAEFTAAEMLALRQALAAGSGLSRAADELAAIVNDTARAANAIIGSSEEIDNLVLRLRATAGRDPGSDVADELAEHSLTIFQACGFQDLTGQRIANVVDVLHEFDRKLKALRDLWNGIAEKRPPSSPANDLFVEPAVAASLENGPRLPADAGHLTQAEIDAIFE